MKSQRSFLFYHWGKYALYITQPFHTFSNWDNSGYNKLFTFFSLVFHERKAFETVAEAPFAP